MEEIKGKWGDIIWEEIDEFIDKVSSQNSKKEIDKFIDKVSSQSNKDELMSIYLSYIASLNPLKRVKQCKQYKIAMDVIKIEDILKEYDNASALEKIYNGKYKTIYISDKVKHVNKYQNGIVGINQLVKQEKKNIEMVFNLKNIEWQHDYLYLKLSMTILLAILSIVALRLPFLFQPNTP